MHFAFTVQRIFQKLVGNRCILCKEYNKNSPVHSRSLDIYTLYAPFGAGRTCETAQNVVLHIDGFGFVFDNIRTVRGNIQC